MIVRIESGINLDHERATESLGPLDLGIRHEKELFQTAANWFCCCWVHGIVISRADVILLIIEELKKRT